VAVRAAAEVAGTKRAADEALVAEEDVAPAEKRVRTTASAGAEATEAAATRAHRPWEGPLVRSLAELEAGTTGEADSEVAGGVHAEREESEAGDEEQALRRELAATSRLLNLYEEQYWHVLEDLQYEQRQYTLVHGHNGRKEEGAQQRSTPGECSTQGCSAAPLPLTRFCIQHILSDPEQCLFAAGPEPGTVALKASVAKASGAVDTNNA